MQTDEEYKDRYLSTVDATTLKRSFTLYSRNWNEDEEIDWREKGLVSGVSQKPCVTNLAGRKKQYVHLA